MSNEAPSEELQLTTAATGATLRIVGLERSGSGGGVGGGVAGSGWSVVAAGGRAPSPRSLHVADVFKGGLYVFGGYDGASRSSEMFRFDLRDRVWTLIPDKGTPPSPRDRHVGCVLGGLFVIFGGFNGQVKVNDLFAFDFEEGMWFALPNQNPPTPRHSHASAVYGNKIYIFGGYDGLYKNDLHAYNIETRTWSLIATLGKPPRPRYRTSLSTVGDKMVCFGGHDGNKHLNDVHVFDFITSTWTQIYPSGQPPVPRDSHSSVVFGESIYIFGGSTGSAMNDFHELQLCSKESTTVEITDDEQDSQQDLSLSPKSSSNSEQVDEGASGNNDQTDEGASSTTVSRVLASPKSPFFQARWVPMKTTGVAPSSRFCHTAVVFDSSMYLFGGYDGSSRLDDFLQFNFITFTVDVPRSTLAEDMFARLHDPFLSDITFMVGDRPVYAHRVLCIRCPYFLAMFTSEMKETTEKVIHIEGVSHEIFLLLLEFIYTDRITSGVEIQEVLDLIHVADRFNVDRLYKLCENSIITSINVENAAQIFAAANMHSTSSLRRKCLTFIVSNFDSVSKTNAFDQLGRDNWDLVSEIFLARQT